MEEVGNDGGGIMRDDAPEHHPGAICFFPHMALLTEARND
jgi:hypothetical protein